jgi:hypothetical protein
MHRTLRCILTPEDRATHAKWMRLVAAFYGCAALLLLWAALAFPSTSPVQPRGSALVADHRTDPGFPKRLSEKFAQQRERRSDAVVQSREAHVGPDAHSR